MASVPRPIPSRAPAWGLRSLLRLLRHIPTVLLPVRRAVKRAKLLEREGELEKAYESFLRAMDIITQPDVDPFNPPLVVTRINLARHLIRLGSRLGVPPPRPPIEELIAILNAIGAAGVGKPAQVLIDEIAWLEANLRDRPPVV